MRHRHRTALRTAIVLAAVAIPGRAPAQNPVTHPLDIGGPPGPGVTHSCLTDSVLNAAVASFNGAAATRITGGVIPATTTIQSQGALAVFGASVRIDGTVLNDVVVINGDLRITATGHVSGNITVLGGNLRIDPGAFAQGRRIECDEPVSASRQGSGTITLQHSARSLLDLRSGAPFTLGPIRGTVRIGASGYDRAEGLPIEVAPSLAWLAAPNTTVRLDAAGILRTSNDASGARSDVGGRARLAITTGANHPVTLGADGESTVVPTEDQAYSTAESSLSALLLRRDYRDWYLRKGGGAFIGWQAAPNLSLNGRWDSARETTLSAQDVFSFARNDEAWRPNPLIDDGTYQTLSLTGTWDTRDDATHPTSGLYVSGTLQHVRSDDLTAVSLPTTIRAAMPSTDYAETELDFDARLYLRLDPVESVHLRLSGGGWLSGDPLTIQRRRAVGAGDDLTAFDFREFNCDRERRPNSATPALCDRTMAAQIEFRRTIGLNIRARIAGYDVGVHRPALVAFGDAAGGWLAGDSAGFVPTNRIQRLSEWHSDAGVGIDAGTFGFYVAHGFAVHEPLRLVIRLTPRF
ncbi:MAG TPA: hypothetical protein VHW65_06835 [Gemmatimonadales bacterium]|nr:hypothetical protein [Gemmatimonadales bacterium]